MNCIALENKIWADGIADGKACGIGKQIKLLFYFIFYNNLDLEVIFKVTVGHLKFPQVS